MSGSTRALGDGVLELLRGPNPCFVTTLMPDGSPQTTQTWVDTDGTHVLINTAREFQKARNIARDPRVSLAVADATALFRYAAIRGRVVNTRTDGAVEHLERLAHTYLGGPYPWYGGRDQTRMVVVIEATHVRTVG